MQMPRMRIFLWAAAIVVMSSAALADPPARVGRLSLVEGEVIFSVDRQDGGSAAASNWPVSSGAILETGPDGRAEVQVGAAALRLAVGSQAEFTTVDDKRVAVHLHGGRLAVTVREPDLAGELEIATAAGHIRFAQPGRYRIDVIPDRGDVHVSSLEGEALVYRPGGELAIPAGQRAVVYGGGGWFLAGLVLDDFDAWAETRDAAHRAPMARRHVSPHMTGHEDLDHYGDWGSAADYGDVWYPRVVPAGWAPYRYGRWAWVPPWGWTWIDSAPWGFAPFHYGRWLFVGGRWGWIPGAYIARPVYAPALVAWVGGPGWSIGFGFGSSPAVGWFPLAPREVFVPAYRASPAYVRQVNINHVTNVTIINRVAAAPHAHPNFAHRSLAQAVTVVPADAVRGGKAITPALLARHDRRELEKAPVTLRAPGAAWLPPAPTALRPRQEDRRRHWQAPASRPDPVFSGRNTGEAGAASTRRQEAGFRPPPSAPQAEAAAPAASQPQPSSHPGRWPSRHLREGEPGQAFPAPAPAARTSGDREGRELRKGSIGRQEGSAALPPPGRGTAPVADPPVASGTAPAAPVQVPTGRTGPERRWREQRMESAGRQETPAPPPPPLRETAPDAVPPAAPIPAPSVRTGGERRWREHRMESAGKQDGPGTLPVSPRVAMPETVPPAAPVSAAPARIGGERRWREHRMESAGRHENPAALPSPPRETAPEAGPPAVRPSAARGPAPRLMPEISRDEPRPAAPRESVPAEPRRERHEGRREHGKPPIAP